MDKIQLKQQAKSLLLKGCYKMASNKYARLIQMGPEGLTQRQWSVVHLNQAISYHFLEQFDQALELSSRAIEIDPTYQKAYYRRIQILRDLRRLDTALHSVPAWVRNSEIDNLLKEIREEYYSSLGIDQMLQDLTSGKQAKIEYTKESHLHFYQKLLAFAEQETSSMTVQSIGGKIAQYYTQLRNLKENQPLESFLSIVHMLSLKVREEKKYRDFVEPLLEQFWKEYIQYSQPIRADSFAIEKLKQQEFQLMKYAPTCPQVVRFLSLLIRHPEIESPQCFECAVQIASNLSSSPFSSNPGPEVFSMVECVISGISKSMSHARLAWLKRSFILLDTLVKLHLHFQPTLCLREISLTTIVYMRYSYINKGSEGEATLVKVSEQALAEFLGNSLDDFAVVFMLQQIVHKLDRNVFKGVLPLIEEHMQLQKEIAQFQKANTKRNNSQVIEMQQEFKLIYTSIMLKIDLKHASTNINISALLSQKHNRKTLYDQSLSDIILNTLLLLAVSDPNNLIEILSHPHSITNIIHEFAISTFIQQLESVGIAISFIYLGVVDLEHQQSEAYAKKMGVSRQEIQKARKIQGESQDPKLNNQLLAKRKAFVEYAAHHWIDIIFNLSAIILKIKEDKTLAKWSKIMNQIAKIDTSHFHHPKVIQAMLEAFKLEKAAVGQFFSLLCKKVNSNLLKYQQIQSIGDVLIYTVQNGQHELVIFQSLLGLINLTSNSNSKIRIPIKVLQNCLFEENKYIVHGALELLNNVLIQVEKEEIDKQVSLKEVIEKYISYYRQQALSAEESIPLSDYSHPCKVYSTLISVAIVMDLEALQEFLNWKSAQKCLLSIRTPRAITFFKIAMYMGMKQRLDGKWWEHFEKQLLQLKDTNRGLWSKLQQYMRS